MVRSEAQKDLSQKSPREKIRGNVVLGKMGKNEIIIFSI
jgi:hypothetical protein